MDKLRAYLNSLSPENREAFATRCGATIGYLRKAMSVGQKLGEGLCLRIGIESMGNVQPEDLRPDVDWQYMRTALANPAQAATETIAIEAAPVNALRAGRVRRVAERRLQRQRGDDDRRGINLSQLNVVGEA